MTDAETLNNLMQLQEMLTKIIGKIQSKESNGTPNRATMSQPDVQKSRKSPKSWIPKKKSDRSTSVLRRQASEEEDGRKISGSTTVRKKSPRRVANSRHSNTNSSMRLREKKIFPKKSSTRRMDK